MDSKKWTNQRKYKVGFFQFKLIDPKFQLSIIFLTLSMCFLSLLLDMVIDNFYLLLLSIIIYNFLIGLFVTHMIAGPLFSLTRTLQKNVEENLNEKVTLRKEDLFQEVVTSVNNYIDHSQNR